jgi:small basic protein
MFDVINSAWAIVCACMAVGAVAALCTVCGQIRADVRETLDDFGVVVNWRSAIDRLRKTVHII